VPYNAYPTQDRYLILACVTDPAWQRLATALGDPVLADPALATQPARQARRAEIEARLGALLAKETCATWLERLATAGVPAAPVNDLAHALRDAQVLARNMVVSVAQPGGGVAMMAGNPIKLGETGEESFASAPALGQHTDEVLGGLLGKSAAVLGALRAHGVIR
jgi:crotonobetainyl-CoA:carnitine CoA-transferase CaiB-like acyl-CoA transferase